MFINIALTFKSPDRWWILHASSRVWVQHLSSAKGHCPSLFQWWLTHFGLFMYANEWQEKTHHWNGNQQWQLLPITILAEATTADHHSSSGPELKLRWWTQTLPRLEKKHDRCLKLNYKIFLCCCKISRVFGGFIQISLVFPLLKNERINFPMPWPPCFIQDLAS